MARIKESFVQCGRCKTKFRSPIFFADTDTFETATTSGNITQCPSCNALISCNKDNMSYTLADSSGGFVGENFPDNDS